MRPSKASQQPPHELEPREEGKVHVLVKRLALRPALLGRRGGDGPARQVGASGHDEFAPTPHWKSGFTLLDVCTCGRSPQAALGDAESVHLTRALGSLALTAPPFSLRRVGRWSMENAHILFPRFTTEVIPRLGDFTRVGVECEGCEQSGVQGRAPRTAWKTKV